MDAYIHSSGCFNPLAGIRCFLTLILCDARMQFLELFQSPSGDSLFSDGIQAESKDIRNDIVSIP